MPSHVASLNPTPVSCQSPEKCFVELLVELERIDSRSTASVKSEQLVHQLSTTFGQTPWANRARLRYARALRKVDPLKAIPLLRISLTEFPLLDDYINHWLLDAYVKAELWEEAGKVIHIFTDSHQDSRVRADVLYAGGAIFSEIGDCQAVRSVLLQALRVSPKHDKGANAKYQIGVCAGLLGQEKKRIEIFRELWWRFPFSEESLQAEQWLKREKAEGFEPTIGERFQRAMSLYRGGAMKRAIKEFQRVLSASKNTPHYFQSQFTLAKAWVRLKQYDQAEKVLQSLTQFPSSRQDDSWVWLGRTFLRHGKGDALSELVKTLPADRLTGDQQAQLYTFYGIWLADHEQWSDAVKAYEKAAQVAQKFSRKVGALWKVGWIQYQHEQFAEAITIFQQIIHQTKKLTSVSSMHSLTQAQYWLARSEEHLGQSALARQHFEQLSQEYPLTYYGQLAQSKLGTIAVKARTWVGLGSTGSQKRAIPVQLQQDVHFKQLQVLQELQLTKEAIKELTNIYSRHGSNIQMFPHLVTLAGEMGAYDIGIRLAIRHYGKTVRTGTLAPSSPAWAGAFPMGYQSIIQSVVPQHVDPFLVSGLIREESLYSARVVSPVGAIGLMQLMPATAKRMARQLHLSGSGFARAQLYQPPYNIHLGTHYLGQLINEFQGNIIYAVAAYNAGPTPVQRWLSKHGHRPSDEFVELIGYRETRGYVKRVVGSYRIYRTLFGQTCPPISLDRFC